jgi:hypothetical protein
MSYLIPEERELADALISIVTKYGKLNADDTGIWAGYTPASENLELAKINVKCGSCVFFQGPGNCQVVEAEIEDGGLCRLATIPDGVVTAGVAPEEVLDMRKIKKGRATVNLENDDAQGPCWDGYVQIGMKEKDGKQVPNCVPKDSSTATEFADKDKKKAPKGYHYMPDGKLMLDSAHDKENAIIADVGGYGGECPPATQDIQLNLKNRQNAIDNVGYGPLNPAEPNLDFWQDKADRWKIEISNAKTALCGTCVFFVRTPKMLDCLEEGIGLGNQEAQGSIEAGELGYCNALDFKCASERTCNAWAAGGPITEDSESTVAGGYMKGDDINVDVIAFFKKPAYELPEEIKKYSEDFEEDYEDYLDLDDLIPTQRTVNMSRVDEVENSDKPIKVWIDEDGEPEIIDGHHRSVAHKLKGMSRINAKVYKSIAITATAGSKRAPKKDRIKGSDKNKKGSASDGKSVNFTASITKALENKVKEHNEKAPNGRKVTMAKLKAVYRRGAGAFSTSHRPGQNRNSWAMARVNAFLHLVGTGSPKNAKYTTDNDLLPKMHPKSTTASANLIPLIASLNFSYAIEDFKESDLDGDWLFDCD